LMNVLLHGGMADSQLLATFLLGQAEKSLLFAHRLHWFLNSYAVRTAPAFTSPLVSSVAQQVRPAAPGTGDPLADFYGNPCPLTRAITATGRTAARRFMDSGPGRLVLAGTAGAGKSSMQL
ncbi:unnamed protein product, partial [Symbiodinium sp. KB8]